MQNSEVLMEATNVYNLCLLSFRWLHLQVQGGDGIKEMVIRLPAARHYCAKLETSWPAEISRIQPQPTLLSIIPSFSCAPYQRD